MATLADITGTWFNAVSNQVEPNMTKIPVSIQAWFGSKQLQTVMAKLNLNLILGHTVFSIRGSSYPDIDHERAAIVSYANDPNIGKIQEGIINGSPLVNASDFETYRHDPAYTKTPTTEKPLSDDPGQPPPKTPPIDPPNPDAVNTTIYPKPKPPAKTVPTSGGGGGTDRGGSDTTKPPGKFVVPIWVWIAGGVLILTLVLFFVFALSRRRS